MLLTIDNLDGAGARDYTGAIAIPPQHRQHQQIAKDAGVLARIERRLNQPSQLRLTLAADSDSFVSPRTGARLLIQRQDGTKLFTGYVAGVPQAEYSGRANRGPVYHYAVTAISDEFILDLKAVPARAPFLARNAGAIVKELTNVLRPGEFDTSAVADIDIIPRFETDPEKRWSEHLAELGTYARASYRAHDSALRFQPFGLSEYVLEESAETFSPEGLSLELPTRATRGAPRAGAALGPQLINDVTVLGKSEPRAYVKDYFLGDGYKLSFSLSSPPFTRYNRLILDEEFTGSALNPMWWTADHPAAVAVGDGKLQVLGGPVMLSLIDQLELGGALVLQHGDVQFTAASSGLVGGLYAGGTGQANAVAAFRMLPAGGQTQISAIVNGATAGGAITTVAGRRYVLSTRIYASEAYRSQQTYHSSLHPAGAGRGGGGIAANAHVVMEAHVIDPGDPGSLVAPAVVLYDGLLGNIPGFCKYMLLNATDMRCLIAFTRLSQAVSVEVVSTIPGQGARTRLVGALSDGAECGVSARPDLYFYSAYVPAPNEAIRVSYRSSGPAVARIVDEASAAALASGTDDGIRGGVRRVSIPTPRTSVDCENAALALLDDSTQTPWAGEYAAWGDFLPGGADDIWPGDVLHAKIPSRGADFRAIVREVEVDLMCLSGDHSRYKLRFANDAAEPLGFEFGSAGRPALQQPTATPASAGTTFAADLPAAEIIAITSTTATLDAGIAPPSGGGIEVRRSDYGWGTENDRNLIGRYATRSFMVTRLTRVQTYYLRQYDSGGRYSRYSTVLHVDYPL